MHGTTPVDDDRLARFVNDHQLKGLLFQILEHRTVLGGSAGDGSSQTVADYRIVSLLPKLLTPADVPMLLHLLAAPPRTIRPDTIDGKWVLRAESRTRVVRLATALSPDKAEEILVQQLQIPATSRVLGADLLKISGLRHWPLIKTAALREGRSYNIGEVIAALGAQQTPAARRALGELLDGLSFNPPAGERYPEGQFDFNHRWLSDFAAAATALNGGVPVVTAEQLKAARYQNGKITALERAQLNRDVPARQAQVRQTLHDFFWR
jgi:hypothetical protein